MPPQWYRPYSSCQHQCEQVHPVVPFVCVIFHVIAYAIYKQSCNCVSPVAISCGPAPDAPANGQRRVSGRIFQSTVTYTCDSGYTLQGDNTRTCMANKRWSGSAPTCIRKLLTIRCSTLDIHGHQQSIRAMLLQHEDREGMFSIQRQIAMKQQVEKQYTYKQIMAHFLFVPGVQYDSHNNRVVYLFLAIFTQVGIIGHVLDVIYQSQPSNESFPAQHKLQ